MIVDVSTAFAGNLILNLSIKRKSRYRHRDWCGIQWCGGIVVLCAEVARGPL
jgi:hypothetical protein